MTAPIAVAAAVIKQGIPSAGLALAGVVAAGLEGFDPTAVIVAALAATGGIAGTVASNRSKKMETQWTRLESERGRLESERGRLETRCLAAEAKLETLGDANASLERLVLRLQLGIERLLHQIRTAGIDPPVWHPDE